MKGYLYVDTKVSDKARYAEYTQLSAPAVAAAGGRYLFAGTPSEVLEGSATDRRLILVEFDTLEKARAFYHSDRYQAAKTRRNGAADVNMLLFEPATRPAAWSIESWQRFWAAPDPEVARPRIPTIVTNDVVGYWPFATKTASGTIGYRDRVLALLALVPDLRLQVEETASEADQVFIRWTGTGTGPDGRFECTGVDRIMLRGGLVGENRIYSDHEIFAHLARITGSA
jgi:uncharacterized protein (DUF1330 family)